MFKTIIWATDGSEAADAALAEVRKLAGHNGTRVVAVHIDELFVGPRVYGMDVRVNEDDLQAKIRAQVEALTDEGLDASTDIIRGRTGIAADAIAEEAEKAGADLIVVGSPGHTAIGSLLFGSVTQKLLQESPCPVLVVPDR